MRGALAMARRGLGVTWPNPSVGCVIVKDNRVLGRGTTAPGGRPHAEPLALAMAEGRARGATAYVTLEPCCHWGQTPPCTDALIAAGIARVVIAARDPDTRVDSQGIARLQAAGITVQEGLLAAEARDILAGFIQRVTTGRPMVTLKLASTLDGRIATRTGESQWITGPQARHAAHALRGTHDAVLAGIGTVLADDPALTCRIAGFRTMPMVRVIVDSQLRTPPDSQLAATARCAPTWILHHASAPAGRAAALEAGGATLIPVAAAPEGLDLTEALWTLGSRGITRLLIEGGGQIAGSLLRRDLIDRIAWFHAPAIIGGDGWPSVQGFGIETLGAMPRFTRSRTAPLGADMLSEFTRQD